MEPKYTLGQKIVLLRTFRKMNQAQLAEAIGVEVKNLSKYENDHHIPGLIILKNIARTCKMHPAYFFDDILPDQYEYVLEDMETAYYVSNLPSDLRIYIRMAILSMHTLKIQMESNPLRNLIDKAADEAKTTNLDHYFNLIETLKNKS